MLQAKYATNTRNSNEISTNYSRRSLSDQWCPADAQPQLTHESSQHILGVACGNRIKYYINSKNII